MDEGLDTNDRHPLINATKSWHSARYTFLVIQLEYRVVYDRDLLYWDFCGDVSIYIANVVKVQINSRTV